MTVFAELGAKLKKFYAKWSLYIDPAARFVCALILFLWLRGALSGGHGPLFGTPVILVLSLLCALAGTALITPVMSVMLIWHAFGLGPDIGGTALAFILVIYLFALRFVPEETGVCALQAAAMYFAFSALIPVYCVLKKSLSSVFAAAVGGAFFFLIRALARAEETLSGTAASDYPERLRVFCASLFTPDLLIGVIAVGAAAVITYTVRTLSFDYAFWAAAAAGGAVYLLLIFMGNAALKTEFGFLLQAAGTLASVMAVFLLLAVMLPLEYRKSSRYSFEDDDYSYYVKAVPKITDAPWDGEEEE